MYFIRKFPLLIILALGAGSMKGETIVSEPSMEPIKINTKPGKNFNDESRRFNMILGADITPGGRIWAAWIGGEDSDAAYIIVGRSDDGGRNWTKPVLAVDPHRNELEQQGQPKRRALVGNFWTDPSGRLWLFYDQSLGFFDGRAGVWATVCDNPDAKAPKWSDPKRLFDGALLNKPIVTAKGEWLISASLWRRSLIKPDIFREGHHALDPDRGVNLYRSVDRGQNWQRVGLVTVPADIWEFDEPSVVELKTGALWMLIRTTQGLRESFSDDGGVNWSKPARSAISNPSARVFLKRLASGNLLLVKYGREIDSNKGRTELTAFISKDDGRSWLGGLVLDERKPVTYPDGFQTPDGLIRIFYDYDRSGEAEILMSAFSEQEILDARYQVDNALRRVVVSKATWAKDHPAPKTTK